MEKTMIDLDFGRFINKDLTTDEHRLTQIDSNRMNKIYKIKILLSFFPSVFICVRLWFQKLNFH
jgi:hypothetical protein